MENSKKKKKGRPTNYREEYIEDIYEYLEQCKDKVEDYIKGESEGAQTRSYTREQKIRVQLPTKYGYRKYINTKYNMRTSESTMQDWEKNNTTFRVAIREIMVEQKQRLMENGVAGTYNSTIGKLILSANHGMRDGQDMHIGGQKDNPIQVVDFSKYQGKQ